ncbi:hypothetical protein C8R46DRAFT_1040461 [Mycena filopes]|nr:hypothetical protein C8R46DRAFT_1040461 [Mycena filopes]
MSGSSMRQYSAEDIIESYTEGRSDEKLQKDCRDFLAHNKGKDARTRVERDMVRIVQRKADKKKLLEAWQRFELWDSSPQPSRPILIQSADLIIETFLQYEDVDETLAMGLYNDCKNFFQASHDVAEIPFLEAIGIVVTASIVDLDPKERKMAQNKVEKKWWRAMQQIAGEARQSSDTGDFDNSDGVDHSDSSSISEPPDSSSNHSSDSEYPPNSDSDPPSDSDSDED